MEQIDERQLEQRHSAANDDTSYVCECVWAHDPSLNIYIIPCVNVHTQTDNRRAMKMTRH